ncbi:MULTISPECIES: hypothetical protein [Okeania]|uniref:hypothetical protein n=1 Tax=Okeania TaxID=1458928 RepID=UPI000F532603|nr:MULTISPECIES: hypothetical protein [Okeania]NET19729.1 hypothetical protein [Okeania sp. SIO1H5]NET74593.1 hypothetical protein [Okeania sp. SIO1F9]NET93655.1 hypothetical protein [Okeania sp. SIO1H2]
MRVGDRRQETGDRRNGNERGGRSGRFVPRLFCSTLDQNPEFLNHYHLKPRTPSRPKIAQTNTSQYARYLISKPYLN